MSSKKKCNKCSKLFHRNSIQRHRRECNVGGRATPCKFSFHEKFIFLHSKHIFLFSSANECGECGRKFIRKSHLNVHINVVHNNKYAACPYCHAQLHPNSIGRHVQRNCTNAPKQRTFKTTHDNFISILISISVSILILISVSILFSIE